jgi:hypothetical protein
MEDSRGFPRSASAPAGGRSLVFRTPSRRGGAAAMLDTMPSARAPRGVAFAAAEGEGVPLAGGAGSCRAAAAEASATCEDAAPLTPDPRRR